VRILGGLGTRGIVFCVAAVLALAGAARPAWGTQLLEVSFADKAEFLRLLETVPETRGEGMTVAGMTARFPANPGRVDEIRALGFAARISVADLEAAYVAGLGKRQDDDFGAYHTYPEAIAAMDALMAAHPAIMTRQSIGQSLEGRTLWVYKISDHPAVDEAEPEVFFNAYIHAREVITFEILYDLAQYLVEGYGTDPRATVLVDSREIWIEPVVNPDGVEYNHLTDPQGGGMWRKNRRDSGGGIFGVDLNRNFGYQWGYDDEGSEPYPDSEVYRGTAPFSEPETAAMRDFVISRHFTLGINYHSYANIHLLPFGYDLIPAPDRDAMFAIGLKRAVDNQYSPGTAWELLYRVNGDAADWMYGDQVSKPKVFGLVTEAGNDDDGFWPSESRIAPIVAENREGNLRAIELAANPYRALPPGIARAAARMDSVARTFTLSWSVPAPDPDNPAVSWNLSEGTGHFVGADNLESSPAERWDAFGWTLSATRFHSPLHSYYSGAANKVNRVLTSRRGHLVQPGEQLRFWTRYNIEEYWDFGYVEIATDGRHFATLPGSITTNDDYYGRNFGNGVTGISGGWVQATFALSAYEGEVVWLRFRYNTDQAVTEEGWYVDDIEPADLFATETLVAEDLSVAEYSFVDHAEGEFAYCVQAVDPEGDAAVWGPPLTLVVAGQSDIAEEQAAVGSWRGLHLDGGNPFRGPVAMRWSPPAGARPGERMTLTVHDANGRVVATLRDEVLSAVPADATWEALWRPEDSPSGLYFAQLRIGRHLSHRRLVRLQ